MAPNDVVITPAWEWHGHGNEGDAPAYWIDFLDAPLVHLLEPMFFDPYPGDYEPVTASATTSPLLFAWKDLEPRLRAASRDPRGRYGRELVLEHPMRTLGLSMMALDAPTEPVQTTANNVFAVVAGRGTSTVDGETLAWERGDVFVAPAWRPHQHRPDGEAVLFRVTDEPVLAALNLLKEVE
jgi:gentisate 1,2-dioxygenase